MYRIKGVNSQKKFLNSVNASIFGVAVYPFNRLYLNEILKDYTILALRESLESPYIRENINVTSLESLGKDTTLLKKNSNSIIKDEDIQKFLHGKQNVYLLSYKGRETFEKICEENNWISAVGNSQLGKELLEDKNKFREFIKSKGHQNLFPEFKIAPFADINYADISAQLGKLVVIQYPQSGGGKGTFFAKNKKSFKKAMQTLINKFELKGKTEDIVVSKFVKGVSLSTSGIATKWGTFSSNLQAQIIDIPEISPTEKGNGIFCGHDWSLANRIPASVHQQAIEYTKIIGDLIYKMGYQGFFGLDMMYDKKNQEIYIIECNPRFTGAMPTLDLIQSAKNRTQFSTLHLLEFITSNSYKGKLEINYDYIQKELTKKKQGSHFFLSSKYLEEKSISFKLKPGAYGFSDNKFQFLGEFYKYSDLETDNDFILTEIPSEKVNIKGYGRMARIITRRGILKNYNKMSEWGKELTELLYKHVEFKAPILGGENYDGE